VERIKTAIARQRRGKRATAASDTQGTIEEPLEAMFSLRSVPRLYNENERENLVANHGLEAGSRKSEVGVGGD
jgi:hypothetical protein